MYAHKYIDTLIYTRTHSYIHTYKGENPVV